MWCRMSKLTVKMQLHSATAVLVLVLSVSIICIIDAQSDTGAGFIYHLPVTQDVSLESPYWNHNRLPYLMVSKHARYPLKRSLLQFEDLSPNCTHIKWAKMYAYFAYSHKPSFMTVREVPYISRPLQLHQVRKEWSENQGTSTIRVTGECWNQPLLALDGSDADPNGLLCTPVTIYTYRPSGFIEFDITEAMRNWQYGDSNYGVLLLATNEDALGRDTRFYSNAYSDRSRHAFVKVLCD